MTSTRRNPPRSAKNSTHYFEEAAEMCSESEPQSAPEISEFPQEECEPECEPDIPPFMPDNVSQTPRQNPTPSIDSQLLTHLNLLRSKKLNSQTTLKLVSFEEIQCNNTCPFSINQMSYPTMVPSFVPSSFSYDEPIPTLFGDIFLL